MENLVAMIIAGIVLGVNTFFLHKVMKPYMPRKKARKN